jgi:hypothetical protein
VLTWRGIPRIITTLQERTCLILISYLFAYAINLPPGTKSVRLPANGNIRIFAMSVSDEGALVRPTQPLYDVLPFPKSGDPDFLLASSSPKMTLLQEQQ